MSIGITWCILVPLCSNVQAQMFKALCIIFPLLFWGKKKHILPYVSLLLMENKSAPVEVGRLSHYLQGLMHVRWCRLYFCYPPEELTYPTLAKSATPQCWHRDIFGYQESILKHSQMLHVWNICLYGWLKFFGTTVKNYHVPLKINGWEMYSLLTYSLFRGHLLVFGDINVNIVTIQICSKKRISPVILFW